MEYAIIPILKAAEWCGLAVDSNSRKAEVEVNCPFCGDKKKHLYLNTIKNQFVCHLCKESGNSISLYAKIHNVDNATAYKELEAGGIFREPVLRKQDSPKVTQYNIKPLANRHDVYFDMLQMLELSNIHRRQLINRGLGDKAIGRNMYRTLPKDGSKLYASVMYSLSKERDLAGIPGFYQKYGKWRMVSKQGMFVPVCDYRGYIQGLQIRLDDESERKFRWFSSNYYDGGTRVESWPHVANWNNGDSVYVTEGAMKAEVASFLMGGVCIIGLAGVNCTEGLVALLRELGISEVIEALDMDKLSNPNVAAALDTLKKRVVGAGVKYRSAKWNPAYKGIDDYWLAMRDTHTDAA